MRKSIFAFLLTCVSAPAFATDNDTELATEISNPIASLVSVPFQFNYNCCLGPEKAGQMLLNVQPVIPFQLNDTWTLITRTIVPVIDQGETIQGVGNRFGLGDTLQSFFFAPKPAPGGIMWGAGPAILWPTGTDAQFSGRKWGAGPTVVALKQEAGWTYGVLTNHIWSFAGDGNFPRVSTTSVQPFLAYQWPDTTTLTFTSESQYDWVAAQWTVPLDLVISHIYKLGSQPLSFQLGPRYFPVTPSQGAHWGFRVNLSFLFPQ
jgi:hypothetical protein